VNEDLDDFWRCVRKCVEAGRSVLVRPVLTASVGGWLTDALSDAPALQYRDPADENAEYARGFSYDLSLSRIVNEKD